MAERMELTRPVFFVGFMGAGKTSVARRLARTCGVASVDMDTYIERREGKKVKEIFAEGGEEGFRAIETDVLRELGAKLDPLLISCGGGVVVTPANHDVFREAGFVVYLEVTADEAASRISDTSTRPLVPEPGSGPGPRCGGATAAVRGGGRRAREHRRQIGAGHRAGSAALWKRRESCARNKDSGQHPR